MDICVPKGNILIGQLPSLHIQNYSCFSPSLPHSPTSPIGDSASPDQPGRHSLSSRLGDVAHNGNQDGKGDHGTHRTDFGPHQSV